LQHMARLAPDNIVHHHRHFNHLSLDYTLG